MPTEFVAVLVVGALGWIGYAFRTWRDLVPDIRLRLAAYVEAQGGRQGAALRLVITSTLPDLVDLYHDLVVASTPALSPGQLRAAADVMDGDPSAADLRFSVEVSEPIVRAAVARLATEAADRVWTALPTTGQVSEALLTLRCYSTDYDGAIGGAQRLSNRYLLQIGLLAAWIAVVAAGFAFAPDAMGVPLLLVSVPFIHGASLEMRRRSLEDSLHPSQPT